MFCKKIRPEKCVGDYVVSKRCPKKKFPLLECPEITLEREKGELLSLEERLQLKRDEFQMKSTDFAKQWNDIESTGIHLKQNCHKFNKFVIENMEKRKRARQLSEEYQKIIKEREDRIQTLQLEVAIARNYLKELEKETRKYIIYETYLNRVVDIASIEDNFKNVFNIIELYEYYVELSLKFAGQLSEALNFLQNVKSELFKFHHTNQNRILAYYVQIVALQGRYEDARRRTHLLEILVFRIKDKARTNYTDLTFARTAVWNLYKMMRSRKKYGSSKLIKKEDFEQQLISISNTFRQVCKLREQVDTALKKEAQQNVKE